VGRRECCAAERTRNNNNDQKRRHCDTTLKPRKGQRLSQGTPTSATQALSRRSAQDKLFTFAAAFSPLLTRMGFQLWFGTGRPQLQTQCQKQQQN
jgi:hypothetical protein